MVGVHPPGAGEAAGGEGGPVGSGQKAVRNAAAEHVRELQLAVPVAVRAKVADAPAEKETRHRVVAAKVLAPAREAAGTRVPTEPAAGSAQHPTEREQLVPAKHKAVGRKSSVAAARPDRLAFEEKSERLG